MSETAPNTGQPGFIVVHGNRLEDLRALAVGYIKSQPLPPLAPEVLLMQSNGMQNWLEQGLADDRDGLGICMGATFQLPGAFMWKAYRAVLGDHAVPQDLPFDKAALQWRVLRLLPGLLSQPVFKPLHTYLQGDDQGRRAYQLAVQLADVLDAYQQYRGDWLADWTQGGSEGAASAPWQPVLWRALQDDVTQTGTALSRSQVHARFIKAMQARAPNDPRPPQLPERIVVFGVSSLPMQSVQALAELGRCCQVLMFVLNPCQHYWGHIIAERALLKQLPQYRQRHRAGTPVEHLSNDLTALHGETHDLLATWGRQGRDYLHLLDEFDDTSQRGVAMARTEAFVSPWPDNKAPTRLQRIQHALFDLQPPPAAPETVPEDDSLRLVSCHTALREVEVLHDQLLAWLDADASLQPQDIMVMVPDMESFAAVIHAAFGRHRESIRHIPYSVADASPRRLPVLQAVEQLLHLPESRLTLSDWLGLFEVAAVRARFKLTEADVALLRSALEAAVVRWGRDAQQRSTQLGLPADIADLQQNTWDWGLRRLLLAYASDADDPWHDVLPAGALSGLEAQRLGALAQWLDAIDTWRIALAGPHTPEQWSPLLMDLLAAFFIAEDEADKRLLGRLEDALSAWVEQCAQAGFIEPLSLTVVREHLLAQVEDSARQARFFGGGVQFGTLMPMRSIPFRVVCVLGMNDADYPRRASMRDFDLMGSSFRPGDRSRREDDRYLFLEALLSARDKFYLSWQGNRVTDNVAMPPSVVVSQLLEDIALRMEPKITAQPQPLQPFSKAYFTEPAVDQPRYVTYDSEWEQQQQQAALTSQAIAEQPPPVTPPAAALTVDALRRLLRAPVEVYWRDRLNVQLDEPAQALDEDEPFALDGLDSFKLRNSLVDALMQNADADVIRTERLRGLLPLAAQGDQLSAQLQSEAQILLNHVDELRSRYTKVLEPMACSITVAGQMLQFTIDGLRADQQGNRLRLWVRPTALCRGKEKHIKLDALPTYWFDHVLACAAGEPARTVVVGLDRLIDWSALAQADALALLHQWHQRWLEAWQRPAPAARKSACAWLQAARKVGKDENADAGDADAGDEAAVKQWDGDHYVTSEYSTSAYLQLSFDTYDDVETQLPLWADALYGALQKACSLEAAS